ncbi:MAG: hypothetical protein GKC04_08250 [Methanomicrobiales archaeon]|nr:hypothetical protein [Methanomicrobiales archaeon]
MAGLTSPVAARDYGIGTAGKTDEAIAGDIAVAVINEYLAAYRRSPAPE